MNSDRDNPSPQPSPASGRGGKELRPVVHRRSTARAKTLRQNQTDAEEKFWNEVKAKRFHGLKCKRQYPVGPYYADFVCIEEKIIIEIDGGQHSESLKDEIRTSFLEKEGFEVVRFWNNEVLNNMEGVLSSLSLTLSRKRERGLQQGDET